MSTSPRDKSPLHLTFIDGMRGFTAFYVVMHHAGQGAGLRETSVLSILLSQGGSAVAVFIAISGFCLMLPVTRNNLSLRGGTIFFYKKRIHRILPPYYTALAFGILTAILSVPAGMRFVYLRDPSTMLALTSHLLLFNNWIPLAAYSFNGPLWSIAVECQVYLFFPLIVGAWRRFGAGKTLLGIFVLAHFLLYATGHRGWVNYFFIFGLGMLSAQIANHDTAIRRFLPLSLLFGLIGYVIAMQGSRQFICDFFVGVVTASLMALLTIGRLAPVRKLLSTRTLVGLGTISYSLYLTHSVIQHIYIGTLGRSLANEPSKQFAVLLFGVTPVLLVFAYLFYLVAERPFLNHTKKQTQVAVIAGTT